LFVLFAKVHSAHTLTHSHNRKKQDFCKKLKTSNEDLHTSQDSNAINLKTSFNLKTAFDTENTEKNTEETES